MDNRLEHIAVYLWGSVGHEIAVRACGPTGGGGGGGDLIRSLPWLKLGGAEWNVAGLR